MNIKSNSQKDIFQMGKLLIVGEINILSETEEKMRIHCFDSQLQVAPHEISDKNLVQNNLEVCGHDPTLLLNWFFLD